MIPKLLPLAVAGLLTPCVSAAELTLHSFKKQHLEQYYWSEGAMLGDLNRDGKPDAVFGPYWWEGPGFTKRHEIYAPTKTTTVKETDGTERTFPGFEGGFGKKNAYSTDNFFAFVHDLNGDGWNDVLTYGLPHWLTASLSARAGVCLAALHDVGKVTPGFQRKCTHWLAGNGLSAADLAGEEDHAKVSQKALQDFLGENSPLRFWAAIVGAHHGRLKGEHLTPVSCGHDGGPAWTAERRRLIEELVAEFGPLPS